MLPVIDGKIEVSFCSQGQVHVSPKQVVGHWFKSAWVKIGDASEPTYHNVPLVAAGAITGVVRHHDGRTVEPSTSIRLQTIERAPEMDDIHWSNDEARTSNNGDYFLGPIPLHGTYFVYANQDPMFAAVGPIRIDKAQPLSKVDIVLPRGVNIPGKVTDQFHRPLSGIPVRYNLSQFNLSHGMLPVATDSSGTFNVGPISPDVREQAIVIRSRKNFQSTRVDIEDLKKPIVVRLKIGKCAAGVVLDKTSGWPIPNVEVYAQPEDQGYCAAEARTDAKGRFRFSNLPDRRTTFTVRGMTTYGTPAGTIVSAPGNMGMTFRVEANSRLQPRKPK
ncbi:MAG: carboxypeptidase-like regulatory domain-containing protein [Planctomycetales bacterium]